MCIKKGGFGVPEKKSISFPEKKKFCNSKLKTVDENREIIMSDRHNWGLDFRPALYL
jgi:hypothetical protein